MKKTLKIIIQSLPYVFFALAVILILQIVFAIKDSRQPTVLGYSLSFVLTPSMEPTIDAGDLILSRSVKPEDLEVGDIITFRADIPVGNSTREESVTHRIVQIQEIGGIFYFTTKGDNNSVTYAWEVATPEDKIVSQYRGKSAFLGNIYQAVFTGENRFSYLYAIAILLFLLIAFTEMLNIIREISNHKKAEQLKLQETMIQEELAKLRAEHPEPIANQAEDKHD
jgi:signal peptidase I